MLAEMGGVPGVAAALRTDPKQGIYDDELKSSFQRRIDQFGVNSIPLVGAPRERSRPA
jgi:hypothetical protein